MKLFTVLAVICFYITPAQSFAQKRPIEKCRLAFILPGGFEYVEFDDKIQTFQSSRPDTFLAMSKTIRDSHYNLFTARAIAMEDFNNIILDDKTFEVQISEETLSDMQFTVIRWFRKQNKKSMTYHMTAYNDECNVVYKFELCTKETSMADMDFTFITLLESCRISG
jgi:hypothetical protein